MVTGRPCPQWHSDYVGCRFLVTYSGAGTLFAPPEAVLSEQGTAGPSFGGGRGRGGGGGIRIDESLALRAEPFDFLFLKGRASAAAVEAAAAAEAEAASRSPLRRWLLSFGGDNENSRNSPSPSRRSLLAVGAVHRSPAGASEGENPRLVLTVDDACECCGDGG